MERAIGIELRKLSNLTCRYFEQKTNKKQVDAITGTNGWIIGYIADQESRGNPVFQRDLENRFGITRSTASKVVSLMVQKGLVEQRPVPDDKRLRRLVLTERAQQVKQLMDEDHLNFERTLRRGLSDADVRTLFSLLDKLKDNLRFMDEREGERAE
ncbi:MAG: MarR family transcriptional regulator [Clostridia bacterium]|nr:MarR family transcriptional regulator [Clostridia bacterium]